MRFILSAVLAVYAVAAQAVVTTDYQSYELKNGLKLVVVPDHRAPVITSMLWYPIGAADEVKGKTGLAHFLEHLMFKGTDTVPAGEFSKRIAASGGQDNAFTSYDYTAYYQKMAKNKIELALKMEADRMENLNINAEHFEPEKQVVLEERRMRVESKPMRRFFEELVKKHFTKHSYGNPVIGWRQDIENATYEDAKSWWQKYYAPNNATLILVGDITMAEALPMVEKYYSNIPKREVKIKPFVVEPPRSTEIRYVKKDKQAKVSLLYRMYRAPSLFAGVAGKNTGAKEALPLTLLSEVLGGSETSYLYQKLVLEQNIADEISADYYAISRGESSFSVYMQPKQGVDIAVAEKALDKAIADFFAIGVTEEELKRAAVRLKAADVYARDSVFNTALRLGRWLVSGGDLKRFDDWLTKIDVVKAEELMRVGRTYLVKDRSTTGLLLPEETK